ncbi:MAG: hypothetical protein WAU89_02280 [Candidatus Acidiferrales bacterium]
MPDAITQQQATAVTLVVRPEGSGTPSRRRELARRVIEVFTSELANSRLLCFLDDQDPPIIRFDRGPANRGFYAPIHDGTPLDWVPDYASGHIYVDDGVSVFYPRVVDGLIYLHGSTCDDEVGLVMTLAHELQHAVQHAKSWKIWALNSLVNELDRSIIREVKLTWADVPIEVEARIISKRIAEQIFGHKRVTAYIDGRIVARVTEADVTDWIYVRSLDSTISVDLDSGSRLLFTRLRDWRSELQAALQRAKAASQSYNDVSLDSFFDATERRTALAAIPQTID